MKRLIILILMFFVQVQSKAQDWEWVIEGEGIENLQTAADEEGNLFASGNFKGSCKLGEVTIASPEKSACFVLRYDEDGNILWWKTIGSTDTLVMVELKAKAGVAYIGGNFTGTLKSSLGDETSVGGWDIFLASFDMERDLKMVKRDGGTKKEVFKTMDIKNSEIVITGSFSKGGSINNQMFFSEAEEDNIFYAKYDTYGVSLWAKEIFLKDSPSLINPIGSKPDLIKINNQDDIYLIARINGETNFSNNLLAYESGQYMLKFSKEGYFLNHKNISSSRKFISDFKIDSINNFYFYRSFCGNHSPCTDRIESYDSLLNYRWGFSLNNLHPIKMELINYGFATLSTFLNYPKTGLSVELTDSTGTKIFKLKSSEIESWESIGYSICYDNNKNLYITGVSSSLISFGNNLEVNRDNLKINFLIKINTIEKFTKVHSENKNFHSSLNLHPNPTSSHFTLSFEAEKADVTITDFSGRIMLQRQVKSKENISTSGFSKGIYFVQVMLGEDVVRRKLVIN
ncbi:MAG: T9SS type A sorting domain-containing protein [Bacteroidetes bacterium]|nr:T9SS type A sorting domain-containing protein [Bacteroidota bacterium]HET6243823.1 T9SS type A sorting domain-containing protein [Bacteroidia bacterium]